MAFSPRSRFQPVPPGRSDLKVHVDVYFSHYSPDALAAAQVTWRLEGTTLNGIFAAIPVPASSAGKIRSEGPRGRLLFSLQPGCPGRRPGNVATGRDNPQWHFRRDPGSSQFRREDPI